MQLNTYLVANFRIMQTAFLPYRSSQVHYCWFGTGQKLILCLHGYGESAESFQFLGKYIGADYTLIAIDFPFHGKTEWNEGLQFSVADLIAIVQALHLKHCDGTQRITLLGYSMGGRVALQLLQSLSTKIEKTVLLAPDGLKVNFWYWLATQTYIGNRLFAFTMKHPGWFFYLLQTGSKLKLINQSILKFTRYYINDTTVRRLLYERWTCMRAIRPNLTSIKKLIRAHALPIRLLYGKYDRIIRHERGEIFRKGIESFCTLHIIQTGHQVLQEKQVNEIIQLIES
ncbi:MULTISPECIES: alpha/beta fold hydrolase [Niastella]|uniref:Alpha/beta hydrolase n=1 Tax=Niastella soli TaxID=2821487 RepID=A0ABS3YPR7_9BACT|nr:alpha/beta hydrolase [Niastella soli]MBO9199883.1 alpha/beta hydrolase [Niastella soli]